MPVTQVELGEQSYNITIDSGILNNLGTVLHQMNIGTDAVIISNPIIMRHHGKKLISGLRKKKISAYPIEVPSGEKSKSARMAIKLIEQIAAYDVGRKVFVIAFGGGVVGDLAGYVAAAYKRGIPYVQVPTTLLAQVDSAIGGKVGIDLPIGKNLVGAYYQPNLVYSDIQALATLTKRQIRNGLAEVIKYGVICDKGLFEFIEKNTDKILKLDLKCLTTIVHECSAIKARIVAADEKETKGMRTILNFGHTVGHAIEAANKFKDYHHGEAIALGMRAAGDLSVRLGLFKPAENDRMNALLSAVGLPEQIRKVRLDSILNHMAHDKKFKGKKNRFVLATGIGSCVVKEGISLIKIKAAIKALS